MNIEGRNYTGFQNVQVKGTGSAAGVVRFVSVGGEGQTITITQGEGEAKYLHLEGTGLSLGTGYIRIIEASGTSDGTLSIGNIEGQRAWKLPDKSGTIALSGTFNVQLPAASKNIFSTIVTVAGIRTNDAVTVTLAEGAGTYVYGNSATAIDI